MQVGTIVKLKIDCLGNPKGSLGVCYEKYGNGGRSFIFVNGNYDGFSREEQGLFLDEIGFSDECSGYRFTNVMRLSEDYRSGYFKNPLGL